MTKKQFQTIVDEFNYIAATGGDLPTLRRLADNLSVRLQAESPRFDRARFYAALNLEGK